MTAPRFTDGDVLTAGSLNFGLNNRFTFISWNGSITSVNPSGTAAVTVVDAYVGSGAIGSGNKILVNYGGDLQATTSGGTAYIGSLFVYMGPSGTSPSLSLIGSTHLTVATNGVQMHNNFSYMAVGSTTVDNASTPALVRLQSTYGGNGLTLFINNVLLAGVQ